MQPGEMLGRYRLLSRIGRGGMGEVWLAAASGSGGFTKKVVIKTILPERADDPSFVEMLTREARMCGELNHPNLIEVFDFTEHAGVYIIAMEYVVGRSLSQIVRAARATNQPIPAWFALRVIWECCRGLEAAHERNIIHCDLSPGNIMLSFAGSSKVLDFGVAHSARAGFKADRLKGKYHYMAPERIRSLVTDRRTDVYALGVILYVLFTGRLPITAPTDEALLFAIVSQKAPPPSTYRKLDPDIEQLILRAMEHDPDLRYQDVGSVLQAISQCRDGKPGACSQLDMAAYLGSLFQDAPDLPEHVRALLLEQPERLDTEIEQLALPANNSAELDDLESISIDVVLDAVPATNVEVSTSLPGLHRPAPLARPRGAVPFLSTAHAFPEQGSRGGTPSTEPFAVRRLFEGTGVARLAPNLFDSSPGLGEGSSRGLFNDSPGTADASSPPPQDPTPDKLASSAMAPEGESPPRPSDIFSAIRQQEPGQSAPPRSAFGDNAREAEPWPWATSLIKPT
jgi:eukaryotic-like serine/threonine-protein kinase